jgi:hypothetical protein
MNAKLIIEQERILGIEKRNALKVAMKQRTDLDDLLDFLQHDPRFTPRFLTGRGGSHVWIALKNGTRIAQIQEVGA